MRHQGSMMTVEQCDTYYDWVHWPLSSVVDKTSKADLLIREVHGHSLGQFVDGSKSVQELFSRVIVLVPAFVHFFD